MKKTQDFYKINKDLIPVPAAAQSLFVQQGTSHSSFWVQSEEENFRPPMKHFPTQMPKKPQNKVFYYNS
jgi:hypothetical protein